MEQQHVRRHQKSTGCNGRKSAGNRNAGLQHPACLQMVCTGRVQCLQSMYNRAVYIITSTTCISARHAGCPSVCMPASRYPHCLGPLLVPRLVFGTRENHFGVQHHQGVQWQLRIFVAICLYNPPTHPLPDIAW